MNLTELNQRLQTLAGAPNRDNLFALAFDLVNWLGLEIPKEGRERLLQWQKQGLKDYLVPHPVTWQPQLYRVTPKEGNIVVQMAVMDKFRKDRLMHLIDKEGRLDFQATPEILQNRPSTPAYYFHLVATAKYDRLYLILHKGDQKRIITFRKQLTQTQFSEILPLWEGIGFKSKPEIAALMWRSLDLKEVNKDFYQKVKTSFDALLGIAEAQRPEANKEEVKQFAVRLIGRYIFCWFLKEKEIIPTELLESKALENNRKKFFQVYLRHLFFNTLNEEVPSRTALVTDSELDNLYKNIPYLNGGLFDWHPEDKFFDELDLNDWLIAFVKVLEGFDFTVDESSSQYQLVAIDPEMLGRIFENLLASQNEQTEKLANDRKAFGAFYTPREIVDYMVNESLKAYLEGAILPKTENSEMAAEPVAVYGGPLFGNLPVVAKAPVPSEKSYEADKERKRERLQKAINKLFTPDCSYNPFDKDESPAVRDALSNIKILDPACGSGAFPMGVLLRLMELRQIVGHGHRNNYDLKGEILSKNIFGVDIMPMAVEIARLRAWLSLVLEADYKPSDRKNNFGIAALPNLDFKFVCANSLVDSGYDDFLKKVDQGHGVLTLLRLEEKIQKLENLRDQYFDPKGNKVKKEQLQKSFLETKDYIKTEFESLKKNWNLGDFLSKVDDWNPFDDGKPSSFFSPGWMFGIKEGFDVVIGNPPYGIQPKGKEYVQWVSEKYEPARKCRDSYFLFMVLAHRLAVNQGVISYIVPNTFCDIEQGEEFRRWFLKENSLSSIRDTSWAFESAIVDTLVFTANTGRRLRDSFNLIDRKGMANKVYLIDVLSGPGLKIDIRGSNEVKEIFSKIATKSKPLGESCTVKAGIILYEVGKGKPVQTPEILKTKPYNTKGVHPENWKRLIRGEHIDRYELKPTDEFVDYGEWLAAPRDNNLFSGPRIIIRRTDDQIRAVYSESEFVCVKSCHILKSETNNLSFLAGLLNSALIQKFFEYQNPQMVGKVFAEIKVIYIENLPFVEPDSKTESQIETLVNQILTAKKQNPKSDTLALEREIDVMVYKLYGLSYEEVKVVDKDFWLSEEEYEKFKGI